MAIRGSMFYSPRADSQNAARSGGGDNSRKFHFLVHSD